MDPTPPTPGRGDAALRPLRILAAAAVALCVGVGCGDDPLSPRVRCAESAPLPLGQAAAGRLTSTDPLLDNSYIDYYAVQAPSAGTVVVVLGSDDFDPFLYRFDARGMAVAQAFEPDPGETGGEVELEWEASAGCNQVGVSSWAQRAAGAYVVEARFEASDPG